MVDNTETRAAELALYHDKLTQYRAKLAWVREYL
jgi:hypothetical protein